MGLKFCNPCFNDVRASRRQETHKGPEALAEHDQKMMHAPDEWRLEMKPKQKREGAARQKAPRGVIKMLHNEADYVDKSVIQDEMVLNRTRYASFHTWWDKWSPSR